VLIAGFSEQGPEMHFYKSSTNDGLRRMDGDFLVAGPQVLEEAPVNFDVYQHGIPAMEAMRLVGDENGYRVGGFIAHIEITRDSVSTKIIHRWPDVIGERIEPHGLALGGAQSRVQIERKQSKVNALNRSGGRPRPFVTPFPAGLARQRRVGPSPPQERGGLARIIQDRPGALG
jgi:hypothetical protein